MSTPPPSTPPPAESEAKVLRTRQIELELDPGLQKGGWRKRRSGGAGDRIRLAGARITFDHEAALTRPLTIPAGLVAVASVDAGRSGTGGGDGRFAILHRMSRTAVVPVEEGLEGWLWTAKGGSALPMLGDGSPNLALVFVTPLDAELAQESFRPEFLTALADRSPLGTPAVFGLLAQVADPAAAKNAFGELGVDHPLTDREVAPAQRRHLPTDRPANPSVRLSRDAREGTSVPPPGIG